MESADNTGPWALIAAERSRQINVEGWSTQHDDTHEDGELLRAAIIYLHWGTEHEAPTHVVKFRKTAGIVHHEVSIPVSWPWAPEWWKPKGRKANLVRAGALCLAERERLLRRNPYGLINHVDHKLNLVIDALAAMHHTRGVVAIDDAISKRISKLAKLCVGYMEDEDFDAANPDTLEDFETPFEMLSYLRQELMALQAAFQQSGQEKG